ncbi:MAG: peptidylprolyl isomerase [Saprospiraceae bacterium]|jgi:cyclophilin family peptidyl-prolyl cis-trans isomerase|nr:peptidylprolyl isomerase [Saprospiraceae bacterium]MBP9195573.1 peptidylprolyl isomerase [Saprospiraceae bacterium]
MFQKVNTYLFFLLVFFTSCAKPMASFMVNTKDNTAPAKVNFDNQSKKAETYFWDFGDGTTSTEISPKHKYITSGKYTVKLIATKGKKTHTMEKELIFEAPHDCLVEMETTLGSITIKLHDSTPQHRDNFIKLAETEYYDNMLFHRVINGFMIQGGDPDSKNAKKGQRLGVGGPGYTVPAEFVDGLIHIKGALSAARQGDAVNPEKRSSGSQFYLVQGKPLSAAQLDQMEWQKGYKYTDEQREILTTQGGTPFLDKDYTVFGQIVKGLDIIDKIAGVQTDGADRPLEDVKIIKVRVIK